MIPKNVTKLFLLLYYHVVTIPALSQNIFATILGMFYDLGYFNKNLFQCTFLTHLHPRLPMSLTELQTRFIKGPNSIHENIPHPLVHNLADHSYVSITECLRHHLAHGISTIPIKKFEGNIVSDISQTLKAQAILKRALKNNTKYTEDILPVLLLKWSDDFEPNSSKQNRSSVWISTITIITDPICNKASSLCATYPIGISNKGVKHDIVEEFFFMELSKLNAGKDNLMYSQIKRRNIRVHPEFFTVLMDQPEKRSANYIMLGNGKYTSRWGCAGDIASVLTGIPSCQKCFSNLLSNNISNTICKDCVSWNTDSSSGLTDFFPPPDYPKECIILPNGKLRPQKITYNKLIKAKELSHNNLVSGRWSEKSAKSFLKVQGMNNFIIDMIIEHALNERKFNYVMSTYDQQSPEYRYMFKEKQLNPSKFTIIQNPAFWKSNIDLHQCIDAVMHLIFLGIVKLTITEVLSWLSSHKKKTLFGKHISKNLSVLIDMKLDWLVLLDMDFDKKTF